MKPVRRRHIYRVHVGTLAHRFGVGKSLDLVVAPEGVEDVAVYVSCCSPSKALVFGEDRDHRAGASADADNAHPNHAIIAIGYRARHWTTSFAHVSGYAGRIIRRKGCTAT